MLLFDIINSVFEKEQFRLVPHNALDIDIKGITQDSRKVFKGYAFAAIPGANENGEKYISDAIEHGASLIITQNRQNETYADNKSVYVLTVDDVRSALSRVALKLYFNSGIPLDIIGVTGTNGKTSVSFTVSHILNSCGICSATLGTLGGSWRSMHFDTGHTTPDIVTLCEAVSTFARHGARVLSMEVSSHALALGRVLGLKMTVGVFTNLTPDHLDYHKTISEYGKAKRKLFDNCSIAIINIDDDFGRQMLSTLPCPYRTYSINDPDSDYFAKAIVHTPRGTSFTLCTGSNEYSLKIHPIGDFNVMNMLASIAACHEYGVSVEACINAAQAMPPVEGRFETVGEYNGASIILDYAHTPDGIRNALLTARSFTKGRIISLFGCGGNRDTSKRSTMGQISGELADYTVITSDNPRNENEVAIAIQVAEDLEYSQKKYNIIIDREKAICHALSAARSGDTVLIMGKGHEKYQQFGNITYPFSDRSIIQKFISL